MSNRWSVMFDCNDHRNGAFRGYIEAVHLASPEGHLDLTARNCARRFYWTATGFRTCRKSLDASHKREWYGNWCWDACHLTKEVVEELCRALKKNGFEPEAGTTSLWRWFEALTPA